MITRTMKHALIAFGATAALLLSGCANGSDEPAAATGATAPAKTDNGVAALTPEQILEKSRAALKGATSFHVTGEANADGQTMTMDFKARDADLFGSLTIGGAKVDLLAVGGKQYLRADEAFWGMFGQAEKAKEITKLIGDRWALVPAKDEQMSGLFDVAGVDDLLSPEGAVTKGETKDVDGTPAIGLVDSGDDGGVLYIATAGEPYPLRIEGAKPESGGMTFSEFGADFPEIKAPADAEVVDFESLTK